MPIGKHSENLRKSSDFSEQVENAYRFAGTRFIEYKKSCLQ